MEPPRCQSRMGWDRDSDCDDDEADEEAWGSGDEDEYRQGSGDADGTSEDGRGDVVENDPLRYLFDPDDPIDGINAAVEASRSSLRSSLSMQSRSSSQFGYESDDKVARPQSAPIPSSSPPRPVRPQSSLSHVSGIPPPEPGMEHRRYVSVGPCANTILAKRWDDRARERHLKKKASATSVLDVAAPFKPDHLRQRLKKQQSEGEWITRVSRDNSILLGRMTHHLAAPKGFSNIDANFRLKKNTPRAGPGARRRRQEAENIRRDNLMIMQRIEARSPNYNHEHWSKERRKNLGYLQRITKYPEVYAPILAKENVPRPTRASTPAVRDTRSNLLRTSFLKDMGAGAAVRSPAPKPSKGPVAKGTRTAELRRAYIAGMAGAMEEGEEGYRSWFREMSIATRDPLDLAGAAQMALRRL